VNELVDRGREKSPILSGDLDFRRAPSGLGVHHVAIRRRSDAAQQRDIGAALKVGQHDPGKSRTSRRSPGS